MNIRSSSSKNTTNTSTTAPVVVSHYFNSDAAVVKTKKDTSKKRASSDKTASTNDYYSSDYAPETKQWVMSKRQKKTNTNDLEITTTKHPKPLPVTHANRILPFSNTTTPRNNNQDVYRVKDILTDFNFNALPKKPNTSGSMFEGVLFDPPWSTHSISDIMRVVRRVVMSPRLFTNGMVFICIPKEHIAKVMKIMEGSLDCKYVENLVWVKKTVDNRLYRGDTTGPVVFSASKSILLMFKKGDSKQFELRHQRNPDVIVDFVKPRCQLDREELIEPKPVGVFRTIETLLPAAFQHGKLLMVWGCRGVEREVTKGWVCVVEGEGEEEEETSRAIEINDLFVNEIEAKEPKSITEDLDVKWTRNSSWETRRRLNYGSDGEGCGVYGVSTSALFKKAHQFF